MELETSNFVHNVYCGQTAGWIKIPLGMEVGLGSGDIMLDGDPAPPWKGTQQSPLFGPCLLWPNGRPSQILWSSFVCEISREPLNGFAPNSHRRSVWSLARTSLKVKVKGQDHQGKNCIFGHFSGVRAVYIW